VITLHIHVRVRGEQVSYRMVMRSYRKYISYCHLLSATIKGNWGVQDAEK